MKNDIVSIFSYKNCRRQGDTNRKARHNPPVAAPTKKSDFPFSWRVDLQLPPWR